MKLHSGHFEYVMDCLKKNTTDIHNIKKHLLAVQFNAPSTMDSYYTALRLSLTTWQAATYNRTAKTE